jgi:hypothetical protein
MPIAVQTRPIGKVRKRGTIASHFGDTYVVLTAIATSFSVHLIGDLPIGEILLIGALPVLVLLGARRALRSDLKPVYALWFLWLIGQIIADVYNHIAFLDRLRGVSLIIFFGLDILGLSLLVGGRERRKVLFLIGLMIGALAQVKLQPSAAVVEYPWKFGYAWGAMLFATLVSCFFYAKRQLLLSALPILFICGVNLLLNYRSPVLEMLVTLVVVYPIIPERLGGVRLLPHSGSFARVLVLTVFVVGAGLMASSLIHFVTRAGYLSEAAAEKNEEQSGTGGLLLGGRPEIVIGLRAALDAPILGHGSWAQDFKYQEMLADMLAENGGSEIPVRALEYAGSLIPSHSHIVGSWVYAGITGLIFWSYILSVIARAIVRITVLRPPLAPIYTWLMIGMLWDIGFSPFASFRRLTEGFLLIVMFDLLEIGPKVPMTARSWVRRGVARAGIAHGGSITLNQPS